MTVSDGNKKIPKAVIYGCAGLRLTEKERAFFTAENPLGFILFARNCADPKQLKALVEELQATVIPRTAFILIDQEGGRVARLKPPHWRKYPTARQLADIGGETAQEAIRLNSRMIADELFSLGINVDCLPLADVPVEGSHDIIGDRAYATEPSKVAEMAQQAAQGLLDGGVLPVLKHIPGHGRAGVDSHLELPKVNTSLEVLRKTDFLPFKMLNDLPLGMTAHVLYEAIDAERVATLSPTVIAIIREEIGFDGLLMSDDISMKALSGDLGELSCQALAAGCDLVLHCNGDMAEMEQISKAVGLLSQKAMVRADRAEKLLKQPDAFNIASAEGRMRELLPKFA